MRIYHMLASGLVFCCSLSGAETGTYTGGDSFNSITDLTWRLEASWSSNAGALTFSPLVQEVRWSESAPGTLNGHITVGGGWQLSNVQGISSANPLKLSLEVKASLLNGAGGPVDLGRLAGQVDTHQWYLGWYASVLDNIASRPQHTPLIRISESSLIKQTNFYDQNGLPVEISKGSTGWGVNFASTSGYCDAQSMCEQLSSSYTMRMDLIFAPGSYLYASSDPNCVEASCMPIGEDFLSQSTINFGYQITSNVPEPSQWVLLLLGTTALAIRRRSS